MTVTEQLAMNETVQEVLYMMQAIRNEEYSLSDPARRAEIQNRALNVYAPIIKARMQANG